MTTEQQQGLALFMAKGCSSCYAGVNVGADGYYPFGLVERPSADILPENDKGRLAVTNKAEDSYVFRVAPLRNVTLTAPYFHSSKVWDLKQAVAIMGQTQLGEELTTEEVDRLVAFLNPEGCQRGLSYFTGRNRDNASTCLADFREINGLSFGKPQKTVVTNPH